MNLQFIKDPAAPATADGEQSMPTSPKPDTPEVTQRKAQKLFYMVWSGITKCLKNMVQV